MMEVITLLIQHIFSVDKSDQAISQIDAFYDILEVRCHDVNSYVRSKVIQCWIKLAEYAKI